jgi:hypothetical protein
MVPVTHETAVKVVLSAAAVVQVGDTAAGSVDVTALPLLSTATHSDADGQETAVMRVPLSTLSGLFQLDPPFVDVTTFPPPSTATHSEVDGQETPKNPWPLMFTGALQAAEPPVGFVDLSALPFPSTATHKDVVGQETASRELLLESTVATVHAEGPPLGLVDVTTFPDWSTATQSDADGHETPRRVPLAKSSGTGADQFKDAPAASAAGTANSRAAKTTAAKPSQCQDRRKVRGRLLRYTKPIKPGMDPRCRLNDLHCRTARRTSAPSPGHLSNFAAVLTRSADGGGEAAGAATAHAYRAAVLRSSLFMRAASHCRGL